MWIHEDDNWPKLSWDTNKLSNKLAAVRHQQGRLYGKMSQLGFALQSEASLKTLTSDVIMSSAIEGERLDYEEVRSSIAQNLGISIGGLIPVSRDVEGVVIMMLDATQHADKPLTKERLLAWHESLFPTGGSTLHLIQIGCWRSDRTGPMQVISGPIGREKVHFQAPSAETIDNNMTQFLDWLETNSSLDPVL